MINDPIAAAIIARLELQTRASFCRVHATMANDPFVSEALNDFASLLDRMAAHISAKAGLSQPNHEGTTHADNR